MSGWIIYLFESSVLLAFFYVLFVMILRRETFFQLNRLFLVSIPVLSLLFPLLRFDLNPSETAVVERPVEEIVKVRRAYYEAVALWEFENRAQVSTPMTTNETNTSLLTGTANRVLFLFILLTYLGGVIFCLSRTVWALRWIRKMLSQYPQEERAGVKIIKTPHPTAPFSFLNYVFIHEAQTSSPEFEQILAHERTHIQEKHSLDLLFVQLAAAFLWFNPVIWRVIKSLKTTHEYIADQKIINLGYSVTAYQTLLLRQLISNNSFGLVHNFDLKFMKKRITMMTHKKSGWSGKIKVAFTIAGMFVASAMIIQCNARIDEQVTPLATSAKTVSGGIDLPVLPPSGFKFDGDLVSATTFAIKNDKLEVNGLEVNVSELENHLAGGNSGRDVPVIMNIDQEQTMGFVRSVHMALRKADRRKLLYLGETPSGERAELILILPPDPDKVDLPDAMRLYEEGKINLLKIDIGKNEAADNQQKVYNFVTRHVAKGSEEYVVSIRMHDTDKYADYLANYFYVREGFNQLYQERSKKMFDKDFFQTTKDEYKLVRQNIPMAISIAED